MGGFFLFLIVLLNVGISWWNSRVAGQAWVESKAIGGWIRLLVWCAAIQAAVGFSMAYLLGFAFLAAGFGWLDQQAMQWVFSLWYVMVIVPILGSGLIITIHSWIEAWRERSLMNMGMAGWNTFAQAYNTYNAVQSIGPALSNVGDMFGSLLSGGGDSDAAKARMALLAILIAICALLAGILTTAVLIQRYAATLPLPAAAPINLAKGR